MPVEIIPNAGESWGLGAGWELRLMALGDFLAGRMPEGRAEDMMANATPEQLATIGRQADEVSAAWQAIISKSTNSNPRRMPDGRSGVERGP